MSAYIAAVPFLILSLSAWISNKITKSLLYIYTGIVLLFINALMFFDLGLYGAWGIRLNAMFLTFLNTPKSMFASVSTMVLIPSILFWLITSLLYFYGFKKVMDRGIDRMKRGTIWHFLVLLIAVGSLIIPMRGGFQTIPINQSDVYFSEEMIANHTAENFVWSFAKSASYNVHGGENPYVKMDFVEAENVIQKNRETVIVDSLNVSKFDPSKILSVEKPNVIVVLWESLTAKLVEPLGGEPGVTTNLNALVKEGILFDSIYANGSRSDKGIVALLSGYYPQPGHSIMKMPAKSRSLPSLPRSMSKLGYTTSFYYGGDLNFGNMVSYLRNMGVDELISEDDFHSQDKNSKWGAHDHVLFNKYLEQKKSKEKPFFDVIFTLSSHEPFEFPGEYKFGTDGEIAKFKSAHAYTDRAVGDFIKKAKKQEWWDNTLLIIIADHGHQLPRQENSFVAPSRFHIPMVWLGGAVEKKDTIVSHIGSQIDLSHTLLSLLGGKTSEFPWGNNLLGTSKNNYAHYIFTNGFGTIDNDGCSVYDYTADKRIYSKGEKIEDREQLGFALTQTVFQDFLDRK